MRKKTSLVLISCLLGMMTLNLLDMALPGLAVSNDWITEEFNNNSVATAYDLDGKHNETSSPYADTYLIWDYQDLNVSTADPSDYFNLTLPADYTGLFFVQVAGTFQMNFSIQAYNVTGDSIFYNDVWNSVDYGYEIEMPLVTQDTNLTLNITWLSGATDELYDLKIRIDHHPTAFDLSVGDVYAYAFSGTDVEKAYGVTEMFCMFNMTAVVDGDALNDPTYGVQPFKSVYVNWYNRTIRGAPWILDDHGWNPADPYVWYNASLDLEHVGGSQHYIYPEDTRMSVINASIWEQHGFGGTDTSDYSDEIIPELTITTHDEYGLPLTWEFQWYYSRILSSLHVYNASQDFLRVERTTTNSCDCTLDAWSWGVSVGQKLEWEFSGTLWEDQVVNEQGYGSLSQVQMEITDIVTKDYNSIISNFSGDVYLLCGFYSTIFVQLANRSTCSDVWLPMKPFPVPFFAYNACEYGVYVHQECHTIPLTHLIPFLLPTPVDMVAFNETWDAMMMFTRYGCTTTVNGRNLVISNVPFLGAEPTTMNYTYNSTGVLTHFAWTNASGHVYVEVKSDFCTSPATLPPGDFTLPEGVTPPTASVEVGVSTGEGQTFSVSDPGSGLSMSVLMNTIRPVTLSFGLWASNPSSVTPPFVKVGGKEVGVYFAIEVNDTSAVRFPLNVTLQLPAELLTEATAEAIAKGLAISTLQDGKWVVNKTATITVDKAAGTATIELWHLSVFALGQALPDSGADIPGISPSLVLVAMVGMATFLAVKRRKMP